MSFQHGLPRYAIGSTTVPHSDILRNRLLAVIAVIVAIAALRASYTVAMPIAFSLLVIAAAWPLKLRLDGFLHPALSYVVTVLVLLALLGCFVAGVYFSIAQSVRLFASDWPQLESAWRPLEHWLARWGVSLNAAAGHDWFVGFGRYLLANVYTTLVYLGFIVLLVIFGLPQVPQLRKKLQTELTAGNRREAIEAAEAIAGKVRRYLATTTATSVLTGVAMGLWALATGVDLALLWGALNFLLNYIPIIGNVIGTILPTLYALIQFHSWTGPAIAFAGFLVIQILISNFVFPMLQGRSMALSPFAVIVALALWTWIWGIAGTLIAIPLTVTLVVSCGHFAGTRWIADLLSSSTED